MSASFYLTTHRAGNAFCEDACSYAEVASKQCAVPYRESNAGCNGTGIITKILGKITVWTLRWMAL